MNELVCYIKRNLQFQKLRRNLHDSIYLNFKEKEIFYKNDERIRGSFHIHQRHVGSFSKGKETNSKRKKHLFYGSILVTGVVGYILYQWNEERKTQCMISEMKEISDDLFDSLDNIVLFVLDKNRLHEQKGFIEEVREEIKNLGLKGINYLYTYNEESKEYACILYKGRRRKMVKKEEMTEHRMKNIFMEFFTPLSENYEKLNDKNKNNEYPIFVTHNTFEKEILQDSTKKNILLVLFENTCFLCFLYKPFINSLNKLFKENNIKIEIKKYNIEKNDYAPGMIICRGTPTFLYYHNGKGIKWSEYKPGELIDKLHEMIGSPEKIKEQMLSMSEMIHSRLHLFGYLTLWMTESRTIENMLIQRHIKEKINKMNEDNLYSEILTALIEEDMSRNDLIDESIQFTKEKIKEAEKSCFVAAMMMAEELLGEEQKR